jgi:Protein tyrosine and serine/threonine kinase
MLISVSQSINRICENMLGVVYITICFKCVQILNATQYRCYINERDILSMVSVRHPGIVDFRGCREERLPSGSLRYIIVTAYEPLGSLTDFLKHKTVDWVTACKMCHSVSSGLAHLHTENYDCG